MTNVYHRMIPELPGAGRLGRHVHHDPRSRDYIANKADAIVSVVHQSWGLPLDQGNVGSCTANALCGALNSFPNAVVQQGEAQPDKVYNESDARDTLYVKETTDEGQPYPQFDPGGSGLAVCQAAVELGWLQSYTHAFDAEHALLALVNRPIILGIDWYDCFDRTDPQTGVITLTQGAQVRGGHEVLCDEIKAEDQLVGLWNSWGAGYGLGGKFYMTFDLFDQLLQSDGDATVPGDTPS